MELSRCRERYERTEKRAEGQMQFRQQKIIGEDTAANARLNRNTIFSIQYQISPLRMSLYFTPALSRSSAQLSTTPTLHRDPPFLDHTVPLNIQTLLILARVFEPTALVFFPPFLRPSRSSRLLCPRGPVLRASVRRSVRGQFLAIFSPFR